MLFASLVAGVDRIEVLDLDTSERKVLVEGGGHPTYAATGHVVFARGTTLMAAPFDAAELALTGGPVAMLQDVRHQNPQTAADYALSATGTLAYVPAGAGAGDGRVLVWVDRSGAVAGRAVSEVVDNARDPRLSPDGQRLVLTTGPPRGRRSLELRLAGPAAAAARRGERQPRRRLEPRRPANCLLVLSGPPPGFTHCRPMAAHSRRSRCRLRALSASHRFGRPRASFCSSAPS